MEKNERLEAALTWCKENNLESTRLNKFNRESKKERSKGKRSRLSKEKAKKHIQS